MDTSKALVAPVLLLLVAACGAPSEPAKTPEPVSSASAAPSAAAVAPPEKTEAAPPVPSAAPAEAAPPSASGGSGLTKAALDEATKIVGDAYPGPFEKTYKRVVARLGEPKKKSENMYEWFAMDGGKCFMFFVTKDSQKGHAASGRAETDVSECK